MRSTKKPVKHPKKSSKKSGPYAPKIGTTIDIRVPPLIERLYVSTDLDFYEAMALELETARLEFPSSTHLLAALVEEVGELSESLIEHDRGQATHKMVFEEAVQVAAMALRLATEGDPSFPRYLKK